VRLLNTRTLKKLFTTLVLCLPALSNVLALLLLLFTVFAVAGVSMFGEAPRGANITSYANFEHFGWAMLTLFRCATGEDW
jgi:hypothetical protein